MTYPKPGAWRFAFILTACLALTPFSATPSQAAAKIQHLISPGGIEAWFVQDSTVPLIAMEYAFGGGATQDPADKPGVGNMVADLLDEGSGELDSKTFHERLDRRAIELSFASTRDYFRGSLRMLKDNKDEAFDLLRMSSASAPRSCRACGATPPTRPRWRAASSSKSPMATIPMGGFPAAHWKARRRSMSPI